MMISICGFGLVLVALLALALQRFYSSIPAKELKRLAARGDHLAAALYRPVAYGASMRLLLWIVFGAAFSAGVLLLAMGLSAPLALAAIMLGVAGIILLQSVRLTVHSARLAVHAAPALSWVLNYVHGPFHAVARSINQARRLGAHSGLYEKEDILALLRQQREQLDNRIAPADLDILERAATFDDRQAADIVLPMSRVKMVRLDDHIGPILLGELHASGQTNFLVYADTPENVVGTLFLRDAVRAREGGRVADLTIPQLAYVHEDFRLRQVAQAFIHTSQHMVVVVNAFEEAVGVITLARLLGELVGETAGQPLPAYESRSAIAAFKPATAEPKDPGPAAAAETGTGPAAPASPEATEVVQ